MKPIKLLLAIATVGLLNLTSHAQDCDPPPSGLVAWWRGENNTLDSFGTNNGSFLGTAGYTNGEVGNAMLFNGVDNGIVVPPSASLNVGAGNGLTIEAWVNPSEITPGGKANPVVEWNEGNGSSYGSAFWLTHPSVAIGNFFANLVDTGGGNHVIFSNSGLITTNVYQHVAVTYDKASGTAALYYNGVQVAVDTTFGQFTPQTTYPLYLGERPPGDINSWVFSGSMDEVSLYNRALSSNEIAAIYLAGSGGKCFTPVPPSITAQPTNVTVNVGGTASFSVTASGTPPLSYQWSFGTTNIIDATNATLTLTNVQLTQTGNYSVLVTNIAGSTNSIVAALTVNVPSCDPAPSGMVAWWQAEGNALDSVGTNNGTWNGTSGYTNGEVNQAFNFNGDAGASYVLVPDAPALRFTNAMTVEAWVNLKTFMGANAREIVSKFGGPYFNQASYTFSIDPATQEAYFIVIAYAGGTSTTVYSSTTIPPNQWVHLAGTYDGSTVNIYVNGQLSGTTPWTQGIFPGDNPLVIGCTLQDGSVPTSFFNGQIDEVSLYNRALSSNEIAAIYLAGSEGKCFNPTPPSITSQPTNVTVNVGGTASFSVTAGGTAPLSYQWSFNTTNIILGATNATLTLTNVQLNQAGNYSVLVTNDYGSTNSVAAVLTVNVPPCDPAPSGMVAWWQAEGNALDSVGTNNGSWNGTSSYTNGEVNQAFNFNGASRVQVPDAVNLRFTNAMTVEAWVYLNTFSGSGSSEIVSKFGGPNTGQAAYTFSVQQSTQKPYFIVNAFNGGSSDTILSSISITTHQWFHLAGVYDGSAIKIYVNGQLEGTSPWTQGIFPGNNPLVIGCTLQNGSVPTSFFNGQIDEASLYNRALSSNEIAAIYLAGSGGKCFTPSPPSITSQPTNVTVNVGDTASFSVVAGGTAPLSYQWSFNTTNIVLGATNATLTLTNVQLSQAGNYSVLVTNAYGSTNSVAAMLTVLAVPPTITVQPTNQTVQAGGTASFTVTAAGTPPLAYQWNFNGTNIAGATNATFTFTNVQFSQAGNYAVSVTNAYGSTNSSNAVLSVVATLDHFAWSTIPSPQGAGVPFGVTITAENAFGIAVSNFTGSVSLQASSAGALTNSALILNGGFETGTLTNWTLVNSASGKFITNNGTFIPPGASGAVAPYAGSYCALGYESGPGAFYMYQDISIPPGVSIATLNWAHCVRNYYSSFNSVQGFQVRICDTNNNVLATAFTTSPGGTLLGSWVQTNYDVTAFAGRTVRVMFWVDSTYAYMDAYVDNVSLQLAANIPIAPANSGSFTGGVWSGNVTVQQTATNVVLVANDGSGHAGSSNPFNVVLAPPVIYTFNPNSGNAGMTVTIEGTNFSSTAASNIVFFGAVQASVVSASTTNLLVTVPAGATFAPITVTVNGLTAYASQPFLPTFAGNGQISSSSLAPAVTLPTGTGPGQVVFADMDGDGRSDLVIADWYAADISIYQNISSNGILAFAPRLVLPIVNAAYGNTLTVAVADIDGDGKPDIITLDSTSNLLSILRNISSPGVLTTNSFAPRIDISAGNNSQGMAVQDLNGDGRPDIVIARQGDNYISVFQNQSTVGNISSASPVNFATGNDASDVAIADLDGDGNPDISVLNMNDGTVSVFRNLGTGGNITTNSFAPPVIFPGVPQGRFIKIGDMDGDSKLDMVVADWTSESISILRNLTSGSGITTNSFSPAVNFATGGGGWANNVALGDLNGDGKLDIAVVCQLPSLFSIFQNQSAPGSFTTSSLAARVDYSSGYNPNSATFGDLDGDGKPDLVIANQYDDNISIYQNTVPFAGPPVITTQPTNQTVTVGQTATFGVTTSGTQPLIYQWQFGGTNILNATNATLTLTNVQMTQAGNYSVLVTNIAGSTNSTSAVLTVLLPPTITTTISGANVQLAWPVSSGTFQLQSADSVLGPWNIVPPQTVVTNGGTISVTVEATNQQQYFRLMGQ